MKATSEIQRCLHWAAFLLLTPACAAAGMAQEPPDRVAAALREARALIDQSRPAQAVEKLRELDAAGDPRVAHLMGVALYHAKDPVQAIEKLAPVIDKLADGTAEKREAVQVLGLCNYLAGRIPDSIPYLEQTRAWAPNNMELAYALGMAYIQTRRPAPARESFARMFHVAPDSPAAHVLTAQMMIRVEFEEFAQAELKQALAKDPKLPQAHFLLGEIAIFRARLDEGIAEMESELGLNPANSMALYRLGDAYTRQLKWDDAIAALQKSVWLNPHYSGPYILLGKSYLRKGQPATAEGMLRRAVQFDPNNKSAHYLLGQVLQQLGRSDDAKREFDIAQRLYAESAR